MVKQYVQLQEQAAPKTKKFKSMSDKFKKRGFAARVGKSRDKQTICDYLNDELTRHVKTMIEGVQRDKLKVDMEKTKLRRREREKKRLNAKLIQHERSSRINRGEEPAKVDAEMADKFNEAEEKKERKEKVAVKEDQIMTLAKKMMEDDKVQNIIGVENICEHLNPEYKIGNVVEAMIQKMVDGGKSVMDFKTP